MHGSLHTFSFTSQNLSKSQSSLIRHSVVNEKNSRRIIIIFLEWESSRQVDSLIPRPQYALICVSFKSGSSRLGWTNINLIQSCKNFKKFRSRSAHHNDLRQKIKIKFTSISELDLSFQFTMIWCELKFMVRSRVVQCPLLKGGKKNAKALSTPSFQ